MVERQRVLDDDRASMVEQITAGSKNLKQCYETHAENQKDLLPHNCRAGMARLTDLELKAEELEAELISQQDMEDRVNKLDALISDRLRNAADGCDTFRARLDHLESRLNTAMGDSATFCLVVTTNGTVETDEEAPVYIQRLGHTLVCQAGGRFSGSAGATR